MLRSSKSKTVVPHVVPELSADEKKYWGEQRLRRSEHLTSGQEHVRRGMQRYIANILIVVIVLLVGVLIYGIKKHFEIVAGYQRKPGLVFTVAGGVTTAHSADEFQLPALPVEQQGKALRIVTLIETADSSNFDLNYKEAREQMTEKMQKDFDAALNTPEARKDLMDLHFYSRVKIDPGGDDITFLATEDGRGIGVNTEVPGYHLIVKGRREAYRIGTNEPIGSASFAYYVHLVDAEMRSVTNPTGLKVNAMMPVKQAAPDKELKEDAK